MRGRVSGGTVMVSGQSEPRWLAGWRRLALVLTAVIGLGSAVGPLRAADETPPAEPPDYRMEDFRAPTPLTLKGARVVDSDQAFELWKAGELVFVDVLPRAPKPANLPAGTIWRDKPRKNIPGSIWLPNVGYGAIAAETDQYFRRNLTEATKGDLAKPLVFYCLKSCWMSWNAAKRAMEYGYTNVTWYPGGTDGWGELDNPTELSEPKP